MEEFAYTNLYSLGDLRLHEKNFTDRAAIKPWLSRCLFESKGIKVVIERSDRNKIIFKCRNGREKEKSSGNTRRLITCPFKIRANFSTRSNQWNLVVLNEYHNHSIDHLSGGTGVSSVPDDFFDDHLSGEKLRVTEPEATSNHQSQKQPTKNGKSAKIKSKSNRSKPKSKYVAKPKRTSSKSIIDFDLHNHKESDMRPLSKRDLLVLDKHDEFKLDDEVANSLGNKINDIIKHQISMNHMINEDSKANIIRTLINNILLEHKDTMGLSHDENALLKSSVNAWFSTSPSSTNNPSANLIPLSPLLNDSDNDYHGSNHSPSANQTTLDSLTLPGISSNFLVNSSNAVNHGQTMNNSNNFVMPNQLQLSQIQNQNRQLPSFNSIQNSLPLSPISSNSNVLMFNTNNASVLPTPSNNNGTSTNEKNATHGNSNANSYTNGSSKGSANMNILTNNNFTWNLGMNNSSNGFINSSNSTSTLNPSHLLKTSNSKNNLVNNLFAGDTKSNGNSSVNVNNYLGSLSNVLTNSIPGVSSPNNNSMNANQSIMKSFISKDDPLAYKLRNESDNE